MLCVSSLTLAFGLFWLAWILVRCFTRASTRWALDLFTQMHAAARQQRRLANAIVGSLMMAALATLIGTPVGILAGTYLAEFGRRGWLAPATRFINDILLSAPSIVIGLFVYSVYVAQVRHFSGWAGALALALIVIPVVVRTTEDMLQAGARQPARSRRRAGRAALEDDRVRDSTARRAAGILTGILLAVARISGETAPLLFTALNNQFLSLNMNQPMANLPVVIFQFAMSPYDDWHRLAWGGALLITLERAGAQHRRAHRCSEATEQRRTMELAPSRTRPMNRALREHRKSRQD